MQAELAVDGSRTRTSQADGSAFTRILRQRLDGFFVEQHVSPKMDVTMMGKLVVGFASWASTYAALYVFALHSWSFVLVYVLHGVTHIFLMFNVAHDTTHNAISRKRSVNNLFSIAFEVCGLSSYVFSTLHYRSHHSCINLYGEDEALTGRNVFRFSPYGPHRWLHRYQQLYVWCFYSLFSLDAIFIKDFEYFFRQDWPRESRPRRRARPFARFFTFKLLYFTYMLVIPVVALGISPLLVAFAFLAAHLVMGLTVTIVFQISHIVEHTTFPTSREEFEDYTHHVLATTADYATRSPLVNWLVGGLNHHVVHHLCPGVCHTHYPSLTRIVKETAAQYGVTYREAGTIREALAAHLALLKRLGRLR